MSRPKMANIKTFPLYNLLHTIKQKMYCGVDLTILHSLKENKLYYTSIEVWAFCATRFKARKDSLKLSVDLPLVTDTKVVSFLNEHCWKDWVIRQKDDSDIKEIIAALDRLFPDKEKVFFYELDSILATYTHGTFLSFDESGNIKTPAERHLENRKYYTEKYDRRGTSLDLTDVFLHIGQNAVCYPFIFTNNTAEWSKEKYGKLVGYAHAGEIFFINTPDKVFFSVTRHY